MHRLVFVAVLAFATTASAGAVGGYKKSHDFLNPKQLATYTISFEKDKDANIMVAGDTSQDLDCYLYDDDHNLIIADEDTSDFCLLDWTPTKTQTYKFIIINRGKGKDTFNMITN